MIPSRAISVLGNKRQFRPHLGVLTDVGYRWNDSIRFTVELIQSKRNASVAK
ncbi:MAG: hypothetical protein OSB44_07180 [Verrucomicrobiales bacterium]|nr:hypothetical protein [Verrucomicrobiales bacterium]